MGIYLNPGNSGFERIIAGEYIDKSKLISCINDVIGTTNSLVCISRPRRFGKSYAAQMMCAYYDCKCNSHAMFDGLQISKTDSYEDHLNQYNVVYLDVTGFISNLKKRGKSLKEVPNEIVNVLIRDLKSDGIKNAKPDKLTDHLLEYAESTGRKFIFIIDEWDAVIREAKDDADAQEKYLNLLREWFKNGNFTPKAVAAAYMTGILPIKKDGTESAISDFKEYTILNPGRFAEYTGFTEIEVQALCKRHNMDFDRIKEWYDGYSFDGENPVYNPYSVMSAIDMNSYESFWQKTSSAESLFTYIDMNYDGLQDDVIRLIAGENIEVDINGFENDVNSFKSKDDVLTLLIHLGYLGYNRESHTARIPNREVETEFKGIIRNPGRNKLAELVRKSEKLLQATYAIDAHEVEKIIDEIRASSYAPMFYNNEQALRYVIKFAYIAAVDRYVRIEEVPTGKGIADVLYIPKKGASVPAMVVELKWNKDSKAAISQIKKNCYPNVLRDYGGDILLVGIDYDEKEKTHKCIIERMRK